MARVIVSSGHTLNDPGAISGELREVNLTRKIAGLVTNKLRNKGIITLSVPPELDLMSRIDWINKTGYSEETEDVCIEIHINDGGKTGLEGWYKEKGENNSKKLTETILQHACKRANLEDQGAKSEYDHPLKTLAFLHNTKPTSTLIECLYIDNPADQAFLRDDSKLEILAQGIVEGIVDFIGIGNSISNKDNNTNSPRQFNPPPQIPSSPYTPYAQRNTALQQSYAPKPPYGANTYQSGTQSLSKEERVQIIKEKYQQVLGRKVSDQDLNYFVNLGLDESQMMKRLVESQEHADIISQSQEFQKIKPEYEQLKNDCAKLKSQKADQEELIKRQNELIEQKNSSIQNLQTSIDSVSFPSSSIEQQETKPIRDPKESLKYFPENNQKEKLTDKVLRKLNDIFD